MSGGRWVREDNGDYQHYTDEEYGEKKRSEGVVTALAMVIGGAIFGYLSFMESDFVFGDFGNGSFMLFCGSVCAVIIGAIILVNTSSISEVMGYLVLIAILGGIMAYVFNCGGDKKDEKKEAKTEAVSAPPTTQNNVASTYSSETVENEEVFQDNEEIVEEESVNEESIDESSTVDNSSESAAASSNKCYYVYGSVKELREQNILFDNNVNMQVENLSYFTEIDCNESKVIKLYSPRAEVRSYHPKDSYKLILDNNGNFMLNIINPSDFWKYSNLLVITTD
jgi:hypothetical protein